MSMTGIAKYLHFSRAIDLTREKDRYFRLPERGVRRNLPLTEQQASAFSSACSRRVMDRVLPA